MEAIYGFVGDMADEVIGIIPRRTYPTWSRSACSFLSCNLIGLVPGLESPTAVPIVPLGCALLTWFYYHYQGLRTNGPVGYFKHFIGTAG